MQYELTTPCTAADLAPLKAGDTVLLSGVVYTARDQAHKRMLEALDKGEKLPFDLEGSAIYYVGPTFPIVGIDLPIKKRCCVRT